MERADFMTYRLRKLSFLFFSILTIVIFYSPLRLLMVTSLQYDEMYSHIILIPVVSGYFMFIERGTIFSKTRYAFAPGIILIIAALVLYLSGMTYENNLDQNDYLSLMTFSSIIFWTGGFVLFYGVQALRNASFPFLFLIFMIPLPGLLAHGIISLLQRASTEVSYVFFKITGVPVLREGFVFHLPGISVEVAEQCSGIRSSLSLFITSIIAGKLFLSTGWRRAILALAVFPITIMKNGVRIVSLSLLGAYVDERILSSTLHRRGGIPFFIFALLLLFPVLWSLRRSEKKMSSDLASF